MSWKQVFSFFLYSVFLFFSFELSAKENKSLNSFKKKNFPSKKIPLRFLEEVSNYKSNPSSSAPIHFYANEVVFDDKEQVVHLKGEAQIHYKSYFLSSSKASFFLKSFRILAEKEVFFQSEDKKFKAEKLDFNFSTLIGTLYKAELKWNKLSIYGEKIQKTKKNTYIVKNGNFTSCVNCPPFLSFSSSSLKLKLEKGVSIKHVFVKIFDKPFFYFPYFFFPLKSKKDLDEFEHQSRFLFPRLDFTDLGFIFSQDFLLDLSKNQDLILTGRYYSERGLKFGFQHLYTPQSKNYGKMEGAFIQDQDFHPSFPTSRKNKKLRGYFKYNHHYVLPFEWIQRLNINHMTDLHYNKHYPDEMAFHGEGSLESRLSVTKNFKNHHLNAEMAFYTNLLKSNPFAKNKDSVHRWPEIHYSLLEKKIKNTNFSYKFDLNYIHFFRSHSYYEDLFITDSNFRLSPERDGLFNYETRGGGGEKEVFMDQIRTGQRLYFQPQLLYFFPFFDKVHTHALLSYKNIFYRFHPSSSTAREAGYKRTAGQRSLNIELTSQTNFYRIFPLNNFQYKHEMKPKISYQNTPWFQPSNHPFFGNFETLPLSQSFVPVSDRDFFSQNKKIQFDYRDRLYNHQILKFSLKHRLVEKKEIKKTVQYKEILTWTTEQSFDINNYKQIKAQPWSPLRNILKFSLDPLRFQHIWNYFYYSKVSSIDSRLYIEDTKKRFIHIAYEQAFVIKEDNSYDRKERTENLKGGMGFRSRYLDFSGELIHSLVTQKLQKWSYTLNLKFPGDCFSVYFQQIQEVGVDSPYFKIQLNYKI